MNGKLEEVLRRKATHIYPNLIPLQIRMAIGL